MTTLTHKSTRQGVSGAARQPRSNTLRTHSAVKSAGISSTVKSRPHSEAMVELLQADPTFASAYLQAALEDCDTPEGRSGLLIALRHVAQAQGMGDVAQRAGIQRESLYRVLSAKGNPTLTTLLAVLGAAGLKFSVTMA